MVDTDRKKLYRALAKSDIRMLKTLYRRGVSFAYKKDDHFPVFMEAINCGRNDVEVLEFLKQHGADIRASDRYGKTHRKFGGDSVLHWASARTNKEILPWLIKNGADIEARNKTGLTPLAYFIRSLGYKGPGSEDAGLILRDCKLLIAAGASVDAVDGEGKAPLHYVAVSGELRGVKLLLGEGASVNIRDKTGSTPLHAAAKAGHLEIAKLLIRNGAKVDAQDKHLMSPLNIIAEEMPRNLNKNHSLIAKLLVKAKAKVDLPDCANCTPLCNAAGNEGSIADILIAHGADVNFNHGYALRQAVFFEYDKTVKLLLENGAKPDAQDPETLDGSLHIAADEWYLFGAKILLKYKANIELQNIDGETPLCVAVRSKSEKLTKLLIENGANVNHVDHYGNTPIIMAKRRGNKRIIDMIKRAKNK